MRIEGLQPPVPGEPIVELTVGNDHIDVHNDCRFLGFSYSLKGDSPEVEAKLSLRFLDETSSSELRLSFDGVERFEIRREDYGSDADTLSHFTYSETDEDKGYFQLAMMDGLDMRFTCRVLSAQLDPNG